MATRSSFSYKTAYKCRGCGASSYGPVIERSKEGTLRPSGQYRCSGCRSIFSTVRAWCSSGMAPDFQVSRSAG